MACSELTALARQEFLKSSDDQALCAVCLRINFVSFTELQCTVPLRGSHFHIGRLQDVRRKQDCPGCRLILAVVHARTPNERLPKDTPIEIEAVYFDTGTVSSTQTSTPHMEHYLTVIFGIGLPAGGIVRRLIPGDSTMQLDSLFSMQEDYRPRGRPYKQSVDFRLVKAWIRFCQGQHDQCQTLPDNTPQDHKTRFIDVHDRRVVTASLNTDYIALSYVWGAATSPILVRDKIEAYGAKNSLRASVIPRTIADAMDVVKSLGKRYLWVDSACIIQDDMGDKAEQLPLMSRIYGGAYLVIVAAAGNDAHAGLPGISIDRKNTDLQQHEKIDGVDFTTIGPALLGNLKTSTWYTRGWTFQESILSKRALIFTQQQVYWSCLAEAWREDVNLESSIHPALCTHNNALGISTAYVLQESSSLSDPLHGGPLRHRLCDTALYRQLAQDFSSRCFKDSGDVLWAFSGVLEYLSSKFPTGFIWGVPHESLDQLLLWHESTRCPNVHRRKARHTLLGSQGPFDLPFPSWCWLSANTRISFVDTCEQKIIPEMTWQFIPGMKEDRQRESGSWFPSGLNISNYGALHATAMVANLTLRSTDGSQSCCSNHSDQNDLEDDTSSDDSFNEEASSEDSFPEEASSEDSFAEEASSEGAESISSVYDPQTHEVGEGRVWADDGLVACAIITGCHDDEVGRINVPRYYLEGKPERVGQFVLLSSNIENHGQPMYSDAQSSEDDADGGLTSLAGRNLMLVELEDDIAYRIGLVSIEEAKWHEIQVEKREITLG